MNNVQIATEIGIETIVHLVMEQEIFFGQRKKNVIIVMELVILMKPGETPGMDPSCSIMSWCGTLSKALLRSTDISLI